VIFSQICYSHIENGLFVDVYPDIFVTEMFGCEDIVKVIVTESKNGRYWAITHNNEYHHINTFENEERTRKQLKKGCRMVSVDVKRWNK